MVETMGGPGGVTAAGQQYCLKWNNHQNNLLRVFSRLLGQEQFTDVIVAAEGRHVKCHKVSCRPLHPPSPLPPDDPVRLQLIL
jgi:hypothetical protein